MRRERRFFTDWGPECTYCHGGRSGCGCWTYYVRQHDSDHLIAVEAVCALCAGLTFFSGQVDTGDPDQLSAEEVRIAHTERAGPLTADEWETW